MRPARREKPQSSEGSRQIKLAGDQAATIVVGSVRVAEVDGQAVYPFEVGPNRRLQNSGFVDRIVEMWKWTTRGTARGQNVPRPDSVPF